MAFPSIRWDKVREKPYQDRKIPNWKLDSRRSTAETQSSPPNGQSRHKAGRHGSKVVAQESAATPEVVNHKNFHYAQAATVNNASCNNRPYCKAETAFRAHYLKVTRIFVTYNCKKLKTMCDYRILSTSRLCLRLIRVETNKTQQRPVPKEILLPVTLSCHIQLSCAGSQRRTGIP